MKKFVSCIVVSLIFSSACRTRIENRKTLKQRELEQFKANADVLSLSLVDRYKKKLEVYDVSAKAPDAAMEGFLRLLVGMDCRSKMTLSYSEKRKNAKGKIEDVAQVKDSDWKYFAIGDLKTSMTINRNLLNKNPNVIADFYLRCYDDSVKHRSDDGLGTAIGKSMINAYSGVSVHFICKFGLDKFPNNPQERVNFNCQTEKKYDFRIPTLKTSLMSWMKKVDMEVQMSFFKKRNIWDYSNCKKDTPEKDIFYVHVGQGLSSSEKEDFLLSMQIDNQRIPQLAQMKSQTGLYSMSIAYCPKHKNDSVSFSFIGQKKNTARDNTYEGNLVNVSLKRGQRAIYTLDAYKRNWISGKSRHKANDSQILLEVFDQFHNENKKIEDEKLALKKLGDGDLKSQREQLFKGDVYVQVQLFLNEFKTCFPSEFNKISLKNFILATLKENRLPYKIESIDKLIALEGKAPEESLALAGGVSSFFKRHWGKMLFGGVVVGGVTAAIVLSNKNKAQREAFGRDLRYDPCKSSTKAKGNFKFIAKKLGDEKRSGKNLRGR